MSLHAIKPEALEAIRKQKKNAVISSAVIGILVVALIMVLLSLFFLAPILRETPTVLVYQADEVDEADETPVPKPTIERKPSAPSANLSKVITTNAISDISLPVPDINVEIPSVDFGADGDFGSGFGGAASGSGFASFYGTKSNAQRVAYVIDYSQSMRGKREELMREELSKSVSKLKPGMEYQLIFFAGPAWVAGDEVTVQRGAGPSTVKSGRKTYKWKGRTAHDWEVDGTAQQADWLKATSSGLKKSQKLITETKLVYGTTWEPAIDMALNMSPTPQVIFFMTDGACGGDMVTLAKNIAKKAKRKGVTINTVAMMEPKTQAAMTELAKGTGGSFTLIGADGKPQNGGGKRRKKPK